MKKKILVIPCSTQIGVEIFESLKFNKHFELFGSSHNESDLLFENFTKVNSPIDTDEFNLELKSILSNNNIDIIIPAHDEYNYILQNNIEFSELIPNSNPINANICRFKSLTYDLLSEDENCRYFIPKYFVLKDKFIKPNKGQGSRNVFHIDGEYVICDYLSGDEYTVDCFSNQENKLIYTNSRERKVVLSGISEETVIVNDDRITKIANEINNKFKFSGAWFFQLKKDGKGDYYLMEVANRIAGASNINRLNGVNLTLLNLYQHLNYNVVLTKQKLVESIKRKTPKYILQYDKIYLDYDDTYYHIKDVIDKLEKNIVIITRSVKKIDINYPVIYVNDNQTKSEIINEIGDLNSIFIDDSHKERLDVLLNCNIPVISLEEVKFLL